MNDLHFKGKDCGNSKVGYYIKAKWKIGNFLAEILEVVKV